MDKMDKTNATKCKRIGDFWYILPDEKTKDVFDFIIEYIYTDNILSIDYEYKGNKNTKAYRNIILKIQNAAKMYKLMRLEEICDEILNRGESVKKVSDSSFFNDMKWGYEYLGTTIVEKDTTNGNFYKKINTGQLMDLTDFKIIIKRYDEVNNKYSNFTYNVHGDVIINCEASRFTAHMDSMAMAIARGTESIDVYPYNINKDYDIGSDDWIDFEAFNFCLTYLYTRSTDGITNDNIISILMTAEFLQIMQLKHIIFEKMMPIIIQLGINTNIDDSYFVDLLKIFIRLDDTIRLGYDIMHSESQNISTDEFGKDINLLHKCIYFVLRIIKQRNIDMQKYKKNMENIKEIDSGELKEYTPEESKWIVYNKFNDFFNISI